MSEQETLVGKILVEYGKIKSTVTYVVGPEQTNIREFFHSKKTITYSCFYLMSEFARTRVTACFELKTEHLPKILIDKISLYHRINLIAKLELNGRPVLVLKNGEIPPFYNSIEKSEFLAIWLALRYKMPKFLRYEIICLFAEKWLPLLSGILIQEECYFC